MSRPRESLGERSRGRRRRPRRSVNHRRNQSRVCRCRKSSATTLQTRAPSPGSLTTESRERKRARAKPCGRCSRHGSNALSTGPLGGRHPVIGLAGSIVAAVSVTNRVSGTTSAADAPRRQESWQRPGLNETVRARGTRAPTGSGRATPTGCGLRLAASPPAPIGLSHGACRPDNARDSDAAPHPAPAGPVQGRTRAPSCPITGPSAIQQSVPIATTRNALGTLIGRDGRGTCGPRLGLAGWCYCWRSGRAPSFPVPPPLISPGARGARGLCSRHSGEGERRCPSPSSALRATNPSSER